MRTAHPVFMLDAADLAALKMGQPLDFRITIQLDSELHDKGVMLSTVTDPVKYRVSYDLKPKPAPKPRRRSKRKPKPAPKPLRTQYTTATKAALVAEARANGVPRTAKAHGVREGLLYTWVRNAKKAPAEVSDIQTAGNTQP